MGRNLETVRASMRILGTEWIAETKDAVSGRVLKIRTGKLFRSLELIDRTREEPPTIEVTADATDPVNNFPYAAYHEFSSGLSYIRPSLLFLISKQGKTQSGISRSLVNDVSRGIIDQLLAHGWFPGRLPNSAFRELFVTGTSGGFGTTVVPRAQIPRARRAVSPAQGPLRRPRR